MESELALVLFETKLWLLDLLVKTGVSGCDQEISSQEANREEGKEKMESQSIQKYAPKTSCLQGGVPGFHSMVYQGDSFDHNQELKQHHPTTFQCPEQA